MSVASAGNRARARRWITQGGLQGLVLLLWLLAFEAARAMEYAPHASLWFPPAAVTFAAVVVLGWRALPAVSMACLVATVWTDRAQPVPLAPEALLASALVFTISHGLVWGGSAALMRRLARGRAAVASVPRMIAVFLLGALAAALLAAALGVVGLTLTGLIDPALAGVLVVPWMIGDYAGVLAIGPLAITLLRRAAERAGLDIRHGLPRLDTFVSPQGGGRAFLAKLGLLLGSTGAVLALLAHLPGQPALVFALVAAVVIQLWIVHTEGPLETLLGLAAFSVLLAVATPALGLGEVALQLQFVLITLGANSYFGLAVPALYADNARLRHLLVHDPLTGALSRASFDEHVRAALRDGGRRQLPLALVMIDLDDLKRLNDRDGHAAGDAALRAFVARVSEGLRPGELIGRLGDDEFGLLLLDVDAERARARVDGLQQRLQQADAGSPATGALSASFGIATGMAGDLPYERLLATADAAMYVHKRARQAARAVALAGAGAA